MAEQEELVVAVVVEVAVSEGEAEAEGFNVSASVKNDGKCRHQHHGSTQQGYGEEGGEKSKTTPDRLI